MKQEEQRWWGTKLHTLLEGLTIGGTSLLFILSGRQTPLHAPATALSTLITKESGQVLAAVGRE